jgi:uncharacterized YccA/Bax inhibitor family protein
MFKPNPAVQRIDSDSSTGTITFDGVIHRTGFLLVLTGLAYYLTWQGVLNGSMSIGAGFGGAIVGAILAMIIIFTRSSNPFLISAYALAEGVSLGAISIYAEFRYPGIAAEATTATFGCFLAVLALYRFGVLRASPMFVKVIMVALLGIAALYLVDLVAGLFGHSFGFIHDSSPLSIGISAVIVLVASLSFVIDFAAIEEAVDQGADARYAWRCAFSLLVGLVWLYVEILRLLTKMRSRD